MWKHCTNNKHDRQPNTMLQYNVFSPIYNVVGIIKSYILLVSVRKRRNGVWKQQIGIPLAYSKEYHVFDYQQQQYWV